jgi:hypothetical protein
MPGRGAPVLGPGGGVGTGPKLPFTPPPENPAESEMATQTAELVLA